MNSWSCLLPCPTTLLICCSLPVPANSAPGWVSKSFGLCLSAGCPQAGCQSQPGSGAGQCPAGCTRGWMACWQLLQTLWGAQFLLGHTELRSHTAAPGLPPTAPEVLWHWLATHTALVSPAATTPGPPTPQPRLLSDMQPDPLGTEPCSTEMNTICLLTGVRGLTRAFTFQ